MTQQVSISAEREARAAQLALGRLVRLAARVMHVPAVALALLDPGSGELETHSAEGFAPELARPARIVLGTGVEGWVALRHEAIRIDDTTNDTRFDFTASGTFGPLRSLLCAPLLTEGRLLGTLLVASPQPSAFDARASDTFLALVALLADAIAGIPEDEAIRARLREQGVLLETARALAGSLQGSQVLNATMSGLRRSLGCESALIYGFDALTEQLRPRAESGARFAGLLRSRVRLGDEESLAAWAARHRRARATAPGDAIVAAMIEARAAADMSLLVIPLLHRDRLRGVAVLARYASFTAEEVATAHSLCGFAACAIDNVERYTALRAERAQLAAMFASASDGMAIVDGALKVVEANAAFAELLGYEPGHVAGRTCCEVLRQGSQDQCGLCEGPCLVARALHSGEAIPHRECQFLMSSHAQHHSSAPREPNRSVDFSLTPLVEPDGRRAATGRPRRDERARDGSDEVPLPIDDLARTARPADGDQWLCRPRALAGGLHRRAARILAPGTCG